eukprot:TRINITY_DN1263_c0_g1_i3.p2 TRINITY_DN1263_c0_g1~~TRINITY_DN1263_c0_g1_i3.p2  ORF type:complete len:101 (+),score=5.62 TRINITY_DN1263_c0_g1_i3:87-389(+)
MVNIPSRLFLPNHPGDLVLCLVQNFHSENGEVFHHLKLHYHLDLAGSKNFVPFELVGSLVSLLIATCRQLLREDVLQHLLTNRLLYQMHPKEVHHLGMMY